MKKIIDNEIRGYTTSAYLKVQTYNLARVDHLTFVIRNRGASQTLKYKFLTYANKETTDTDDAIEYIAETTLAVSTTVEEVISNTAYAKGELYIKDGDGKTEYSITAVKQMGA
ncbi:MAG: hypothetical protein ACTSPI_17060 [Candidatus Heimdallarchaeaceae archaeon]